jgi:predicted nucleic acid-binding protein
MTGVVVDTSEWIEYLAGRPAPFFQHCLEAGTVIVPPMVVTELTGGARTREEFMVLEDLLADLPMHDGGFHYFSRAGALRQMLAAKGLSISPADAQVAQCALDCQSTLVTRDAVFWKIAALTALRIAPTMA